MMNGSIPQLIRFERYLFVAYSFAIFAQPPSTFWQLAACSLAEPSPGLTAKIVLPKPIFSWLASGNFFFTTPMISATSGTAFPAHSPLSIAFWAFWISFALPTYSGSFLERYEDVSPEGMSSSVVVTGS